MKPILITTVVAGQFNPSIIVPKWLRDEKIVVDNDEKIIVEVAGRDIAFSFKTGNYNWQVDYNRLLIGTDDPSKNTADLAAQVIEKLPHTPLTAFGNNFSYSIEHSSWNADTPSLGKNWNSKKLEKFGKVLTTNWSFKIKKEEIEGPLFLQCVLEQIQEGINVKFNYHRNVSNKDQAIKVAKCFASDYQNSQALLAVLNK